MCACVCVCMYVHTPFMYHKPYYVCVCMCVYVCMYVQQSGYDQNMKPEKRKKKKNKFPLCRGQCVYGNLLGHQLFAVPFSFFSKKNRD